MHKKLSIVETFAYNNYYPPDNKCSISIKANEQDKTLMFQLALCAFLKTSAVTN